MSLSRFDVLLVSLPLLQSFFLPREVSLSPINYCFVMPFTFHIIESYDSFMN